MCCVYIYIYVVFDRYIIKKSSEFFSMGRVNVRAAQHSLEELGLIEQSVKKSKMHVQEVEAVFMDVVP